LEFSQGKQEITLDFDELDNSQNPLQLTFTKEFQGRIHSPIKSQKPLEN